MLCATVSPVMLGFDDDSYCIVMRYTASGHAFLLYVDDFRSVYDMFKYEQSSKKTESMYQLAMMPLTLALDIFDELNTSLIPENIVYFDGEWHDFDVVVNLMDDEIRERVHSRGIENPQDFVNLYGAYHYNKYGEPFRVV